MALLQQHQLFVFTKERIPANYSTKWSDLHPDCQNFLLQIEELILDHKNKNQLLDQCDRLYHSCTTKDMFQLEADRILKELGGISITMERERPLLQDLITVLKDLMRNTEVAVCSFMVLHPRFFNQIVGGGSNAAAKMQPSGTTIFPNTISQVASVSRVPVYEFYSGMPRKPSPFLYNKVVKFGRYIGECRQKIEELEHLLLLHSDRIPYGSESSSLLQSLPKVMSNVHEFFVYAAAKVESTHQYIESMKTAYLADLRRRGDVNDPFLKEDRRELAKQEAAAKRVHPSLHLTTSFPQPPTQVVGSYFSMPVTTTPNIPQLPSASAMTGFSVSNMPSFPPSPLFSTPAAVAPASSLFGSFTATPQSSSYPSASARTGFSHSNMPYSPPSLLMFSTPAAVAPTSLFGSFTATPQSSAYPSASTSLFGSTPIPLFGNNTPAMVSVTYTGNSPSTPSPSRSGPTREPEENYGRLAKARKSKHGRR